jgi:hypothetical protein
MAEVDETLKRQRAAIPADPMLAEEVSTEQIAEVVSRWTGGCPLRGEAVGPVGAGVLSELPGGRPCCVSASANLVALGPSR